MKNINPLFANRRLNLFYSLFAVGAMASMAHGQIVSDNFDNGAHQTSINGTAPEGANLPGGDWSVSSDSAAFFAWTNTPSFENVPGPDASESLFLWSNPGTDSTTGSIGGDATISIASNLATSYVKPTSFSIQSDFLFTNFASPSEFLLGFYPSAAVSDPTVLTDPLAGFTGFELGVDGSLTLVNDGVAGTPVAFTGTFDDTVFNTLSYDVNTLTDTITNVNYGGNTAYDFSSTVLPGLATDNFAGLGISEPSTSNKPWGYADNFSVNTVTTPEPSTYALLLAGLGVLVFWGSRVRRSLI